MKKEKNIRTGILVLNRKKRRMLFVFSIMIPICIWFFIFMLLPIFSVIFYSFTNSNMAFSDWKFVGFDQYIKMFTEDPLFPIAVKNTVKSVLIVVPFTVVLSLTLALGIHSVKSRVNKFFTFVYFLPSIVSMVAICMVWKWLYHQQFGILNAVLGFFGFPSQQFLNSSSQALICICIIQIWAVIGYFAIILVTAIRGIDLSLYEAAEVDGANGWRKTFYITIPLIRQNIFFVCIMATTQAFMIFTPVKVLTDGMPGTSTYVLMLHIMNRGINNNDIAYASAMSLVLMGIILIFSLIQKLVTRERGEGEE